VVLSAVFLSAVFLSAAVSLALSPTMLAARGAAGDGDRATSAEVVDRFLRSGDPPLVTYRARRQLEARGGHLAGAIEAVTWLTPDGTFHFTVTREEGSSLIRSHVLVAALEAEQRSRNQRETAAAELTPANYEFTVAPGSGSAGSGDRELRLGLVPRRDSQMLLIGTATITARDGDLRLVEGRLSKNPSFWTRRVDVSRRYARLAGVRVPVEMRSRADVRVVGESSFSMTYHYESINGRSPIAKSLQ
jgi:hypothetical protein